MKRIASLAALAVIISAVTLAFGPCGSSKSDADLAHEALAKGLQAHVDGRYDEAAADYQEVLKHDPRNKFAFYNLGVLDRLAGRNQSAENNYRLALSVDPDFAEALFNLGNLKKEQGANQEAIDLFRHVIAVTPNDAGAHLNLAQLLFATGNVIEGNAELKAAADIDPNIVPKATPTTEAAPTPAGEGEPTPTGEAEPEASPTP